MADNKKTEKKAEKADGDKADKKPAKAAPKKAGASKKGTSKAAPKGHVAKAADEAAPTVPRLLARYRTDIGKAMMQEFGYANVSQVPTLTKMTLNFGLGEATTDPNIVKSAVSELSDITGQRAVATKAKKAIANFKLRAGLPIGAMVTLRGRRMWEFLDRLFNVAMPRIRDFKGTSTKAFDGRGNYTLGLRDQSLFLELSYERIGKLKGMNITFTTTAKTDAEGRALLRHLGMPFRPDSTAQAA